MEEVIKEERENEEIVMLWLLTPRLKNEEKTKVADYNYKEYRNTTDL